MNQVRLIDPYKRNIRYLRISITDRCNMKCMYCMPAGTVSKLNHDEILRYEEIIRVVTVAASLGITKVRITGGDPLVRQGVAEFLKTLCRMPQLQEVTLTTNGMLLNRYLEDIRAAGVKRLNISMDTLIPEKFKEITGRDVFSRVWDSIERAEAMGFSPIKLNTVVIGGVNDDEVCDLAALSLKKPYHIRFIEYMPIGSRRASDKKTIRSDKLKQQISEAMGPLIPVNTGTTDGPAERYRLKGARGEIGFISALTHHFCERCNRLRLTASGQLRPCLLSDTQFDMKQILRNNGSDEQLAEVFRQAVASKGAHHHLSTQCSGNVTGQMSSIGG